MYKIEINSANTNIPELSNTQLICSYIFVTNTFNHLYKKKLRSLNKIANKAIVYDLSLFETINSKQYFLRCLTPKKWLESWIVYNGITSELKKRELILNNLEVN